MSMLAMGFDESTVRLALQRLGGAIKLPHDMATMP
jgi:hypothetical protein